MYEISIFKCIVPKEAPPGRIDLLSDQEHGFPCGLFVWYTNYYTNLLSKMHFQSISKVVCAHTSSLGISKPKFSYAALNCLSISILFPTGL